MFESIIKNVGMKLLGKGLESAFGGGGGGQGQGQQPVMPNFSDASMGLYAPSPTGDAKEIERANYDMTLAMWEKRLFGQNSYTDITIPPIGK